uniref:Macaca fascicularis brain cDNA clone: QccE-19910, similar to human transmembrane trafficking protein (TMP21), mRNA, RefSeq: NM_006827.4 n=1 Tax=Macaca fascicularis TaxID=9541 RepID=I7G435_MACFA|nr:unnamed protein product [Macaca fascicularis]
MSYVVKISGYSVNVPATMNSNRFSPPFDSVYLPLMWHKSSSVVNLYNIAICC